MDLAKTVAEREAAQFEVRVLQLKAVLDRGKFDLPWMDSFEDGGRAFHEAKRRIAAERGWMPEIVLQTG